MPFRRLLSKGVQRREYLTQVSRGVESQVTTGAHERELDRRSLTVQHRSATPKRLFGQAFGYARNQWASLVRFVDDARFAINNGAAERAIRPLAIGRANWLHVGGDGGLKTASVLPSVCACATRHRLNPWSYLRDVLDRLALRPAGADVGDLLPDASVKPSSERR